MNKRFYFSQFSVNISPFFPLAQIQNSYVWNILCFFHLLISQLPLCLRSVLCWYCSSDQGPKSTPYFACVWSVLCFCIPDHNLYVEEWDSISLENKWLKMCNSGQNLWSMDYLKICNERQCSKYCSHTLEMKDFLLHRGNMLCIKILQVSLPIYLQVYVSDKRHT